MPILHTNHISGKIAYSVIFEAHSTHPFSVKKVRDVENLAAHSTHLSNFKKIGDVQNFSIFYAHSTH